MERINQDHFGRSSLRAEHSHRYRMSALMASGRVIDCACGIGYGSEVLAEYSKIASYHGVDPDCETVAFAKNSYSAPGRTFSVGTLENNECADGAADTFIMLETLEHTQNPELALRGAVRCLSDSGVLIGSVPNAEYDELCEKVYGANPYHLHRFSIDELEKLLKKQFEKNVIFSAEFVMGTLFRMRSSKGEDNRSELIFRDSEAKSIDGSLFFVAGKKADVDKRLLMLGAPQKFFEGLSKARVDFEEVEDVRKAYKSAERQLVEALSVLRDTEKKHIESQALLGSAEKRVIEMEQALHEAKDQLNENACIESQLRAKLERESQEKRRIEALFIDSISRTGLVHSLSMLEKNKYKGLPFVDLAYSLYLFIVRLNKIALQENVKDLYFFSREGFALKEMFDYFNAKSPKGGQVSSHYLKISRKSSFLPSLGPLEGENFDILFRQYIRMSLRDFLGSLALEKYIDEISDDIGGGFGNMDAIHEELPTSEAFKLLLSSAVFKRVYEQERTSRSDALGKYIASLTDGSIPASMNIVDVGWKGSIQDNLRNWLARQVGETACINGYYIGLTASGNLSECNKKTGLVFSNQDGLSKGFRIFNENRSLYEVLLPAMHGGPRSYQADATGGIAVVLDKFIEKEMITSTVSPVYEGIFSYFRDIVDLFSVVSISTEDLIRLVETKHRRMVLHPTQNEIDWMTSVSHIENFGVFHKSSFGAESTSGSLGSRVRFSVDMLRRRRPSEIGFWPYLTLKHRGVPGLHILYRYFRQLQGS